MAKKTGACANIDCDHYKEVFEIEAGGEFECPYCHQPLREAAGKHKNKNNNDEGNGNGKKIALIVAAAVILGGGGYGVYSYLNAGEEPKPVVEEPKTVASPAPVNTAVVAPENPKPEVPAPKPKASQADSKRGTVDLGYGSYTGELKNGKPHGYGTITYKQEHKIVSSKDFVAQPGDTFEGEFRDGRISGLGYWKHDGNQTVVKP